MATISYALHVVTVISLMIMIFCSLVNLKFLESQNNMIVSFRFEHPK